MRLSRGFQLAKRASLFSDMEKNKVGAVIMMKKKVISIGYNSSRESRMQHNYNKYRNFDPNDSINKIHAEMMALSTIRHDIISGLIDPTKLVIYVYRELVNGDLALARPCKACEAALRDYKIMKVNYTGYSSLISETYIV